ncbi:iron complex transport system permease protein [Austwickia chelonae]|uniref:Putative ABC transporter permease protein n=1 Tax=Austwickia chelonae NBRC 105200 TaxID=1184607 RepID=K6V4L1_9MICO|nr:iron ABC transporter permease [Austwickia chelonae]GAB77073.1 putative ABC transporter permease protein [Austwickia chelonae NBRC 105200]SEW33812.1 iron complex transport system permease protein [Austwickia chelonae]
MSSTRHLTRRAHLLSLAFALTIPVLIVVSGATGPLRTTFTEAAQLVVGHLVPGMSWMTDGTLSPAQDQAVWNFRLPRTLLAGVVGSCLALAGALLQAVVRNPLAEPYVLGVSSGAGLGAVLVIVLGSTAVAGLSLSAAAFAGALLATVLVHLLASQDGIISPQRLILAGVALGTLLAALTNYLTISTEAQNVYSVLYFTLGSVSGADFGKIVWPLLALVVVALVAISRSRVLNAMLVGDESATSLGVDVQRTRRLTLAAAALLTGTSVAVAGGIGFVGLVVPHVTRILVGSDHRRTLPVTVLAGAVLLMVCDLLARTIADPVEVPIGIVTAVLGAPFFLWIMRTAGAVRGGMHR